MVIIDADCLLKNTDLSAKMKQLIPILNITAGKNDTLATFRQLRKALMLETGVDIDLDSFAQMYKSEIHPSLRVTSDQQIEDILNKKTNAAFDKIIHGTADRIDGIGETSTDRAAINKAAGILAVIEGKNTSVKTKTLAKKVKDAVLDAIQKLANSNKDYVSMRTRPAKETFEQTLERVLEINSLRTEQTTTGVFNTVEDVIEQARKAIINSGLGEITDENGEEILSEEAINFLDQFKNAMVGVLLSTGDANKLIRGTLLEAGYGKGPAGKQTVDWKNLAGSMNSPEVLHENVVAALMDKQGLSEEVATSIANALTTDFKDLVQGEKAMQVKYGIAEGEAQAIMGKLGWQLGPDELSALHNDIHDAINKSVATSDELHISEIVNAALLKNGASQVQLSNLPERNLIVRSNTADRISKLVKTDGDLDPEAQAKLFGSVGKYLDPNAIEELQLLAKRKEEIENIGLDELGGDNTRIIDGVNNIKGLKKPSLSKQGLEKAKLIKTISDEMARVVADSIDYSSVSFFSKVFTKSLNILSKFMSANAALVLLNPFNLTQNLLSGAFVAPQGNVGGKIVDAFSKIKGSLIYTQDDGSKINLTELLSAIGKADVWWNTLQGAEGRDIPDLFSGDPSKDQKTLQSAKTTGEKIEAWVGILPRAALTATDAMLKEPYFRQELIRGVLYHLQASGGKTAKEAQNLVYSALTRNSVESLQRQATELAKMVGRNDRYYIEQVMEDIQLSSLVMLNEEGKSILSEMHLQSIIDAAKQTSGEAFGHRRQKNVKFAAGVFDFMTKGQAKAIEGMNKQHGAEMAELYKTGKYQQAAVLHFGHTLKTTAGFLFQRGIYNWAILISQKNPFSIVSGFKQLAQNAKEQNFSEQKGSQTAVENYLRSRAKIGRGVMGTATAVVVVPLIMAALKQGCEDGEKDCMKERLAALRKDPVWGRLFNNFVSPFVQMAIDAHLSEDVKEAAANVVWDMAVKPVVSAGSKYYSVDNQIQVAIDALKAKRAPQAEATIGGIAGMFLPGKMFLATNRAWLERIGGGEDTPDLIDENYQLIMDDRDKPKQEDFMDGFWYGFLFKQHE